jgi:hypothetical protein
MVNPSHPPSTISRDHTTSLPHADPEANVAHRDTFRPLKGGVGQVGHACGAIAHNSRLLPYFTRWLSARHKDVAVCIYTHRSAI